jgi:hypothetical protein
MGSRTFTSDFAILDVRKGRKLLAKHFEDRPRLGECPKALRIPVVIRGYIDCVHGSDDGTSQEFAVTVTGLDLPTPPSPEGASNG